MSQPEVVTEMRGQIAHLMRSWSTWRIVAGLIPMPLALLLDNLLSPDAAESLPFVIIGHLVLGPYSLVCGVVAAFINEHVVNACIKLSALAVPVGAIIIGAVASFTSGTPYGWATAFVVTAVLRVHYVWTKSHQSVTV